MFASVAVRVHSSPSTQGCVALERVETALLRASDDRPTSSTGPLHLITNSVDIDSSLKWKYTKFDGLRPATAGR